MCFADFHRMQISTVLGTRMYFVTFDIMEPYLCPDSRMRGRLLVPLFTTSETCFSDCITNELWLHFVRTSESWDSWTADLLYVPGCLSPNGSNH